MLRKLIPGMLTVLGGSMFALAVLTAIPKPADASRYAVAFTHSGAHCTDTPADDCDG